MQVKSYRSLFYEIRAGWWHQLNVNGAERVE
jgi:hypothetical protein